MTEKDWKQEITNKVFIAFEKSFGFKPMRGHEDIFLIGEALNLAEEHFNWLCEAGQQSDLNWIEAQKEITRLKALASQAQAENEELKGCLEATRKSVDSYIEERQAIIEKIEKVYNKYNNQIAVWGGLKGFVEELKSELTGKEATKP